MGDFMTNHRKSWQLITFKSETNSERFFHSVTVQKLVLVTRH